jgi:hypothetical protein
LANLIYTVFWILPIEEELQELFDHKLISTSEYTEDIEEETALDSNSMISITSVGVYYLKSLLNRFHYIDLVLQDTPIYNEESFGHLTNVFPDSDEYGNRDLQQRKESVESFIDYLKDQEKNDKKFVSNFDDQSIMFDVIESLKQKLSKDLDRLDKVIKRQKNPA